MVDTKQMSNKIYLTRLRQNDKQTSGFLSVVNGSGIFSCYTLELPWNDNKPNTSRIPPGVYEWRKVHSPAFNTDVILLRDVPGRVLVEIHYGNYYKNTHGCLLVGDELEDINSDGYRDVLNSKRTLKNLVNHLPNEGTIFINEVFA